MTYHLFYNIQGLMGVRPQVEETRIFCDSENAEITLKMILSKMNNIQYGYELRIDADNYSGGNWYISRDSDDIVQGTYSAVYYRSWNDRNETRHYARNALMKALVPFIHADFTIE